MLVQSAVCVLVASLVLISLIAYRGHQDKVADQKEAELEFKRAVFAIRSLGD